MENMAVNKEIREPASRISRAFSPERIIPFGSHAQGTPSKDSDVDLLVILDFEGKAEAKAVEIRLDVRPPFSRGPDRPHPGEGARETGHGR